MSITKTRKNKIIPLRNAKNIDELSKLLSIRKSQLINILNEPSTERLYQNFTIPKKNGGVREICAPCDRLKKIQSALSQLLQDCLDDINLERKESDHNFKNIYSHGFVRGKSIITNSEIHNNKKIILNIDLENFFDCFNFGRVRGFFIKNSYFELNNNIATILAKIACHNDKLPQGSPSSPVITNLIAHALDVRIAGFSKRHSCFYSRYADDITISTRKHNFPSSIMRQENNEYIPGPRFQKEINRAGFRINNSKTRLEYKDSRQTVTGLVSNKKPNVSSNYWKLVRAQCHKLFKTGLFTDDIGGESIEGNMNALEGKLNHIDQVEFFNRRRFNPKLNPLYQPAKIGNDKSSLLSGKEKNFSNFLFYKNF